MADMLWDMVLPAKMGDDMKQVAMECLQQILALPDQWCQGAALHGLNHLDHPERLAVVQAWMDAHLDEKERWNWRWVGGCRDGEAM